MTISTALMMIMRGISTRVMMIRTTMTSNATVTFGEERQTEYFSPFPRCTPMVYSDNWQCGFYSFYRVENTTKTNSTVQYAITMAMRRETKSDYIVFKTKVMNSKSPLYNDACLLFANRSLIFDPQRPALSV